MNNVSISFGEKVILKDVNWQIGDRSRIGLVGDNGSGKTTIFRSIVDNTFLEKGSVVVSKNQRIGYLSQEILDLDSIKILEYLKKKSGIDELEKNISRLELKISNLDENSSEYKSTIKKYENYLNEYNIRDGYMFDVNASQVLKGLGFSEADKDKMCTEFSGGWKMRIALAAVLLYHPDIMLLDEPVNHLDSESMEWLESFLQKFNGTLIVVAHDRMFLDKMVREVAELNNGSIIIYKGNYSYYEKEKNRRLEALKAEMKKQQGEIKKIQLFIDRFRAKASKASQVQSRMKMLEKYDVITMEKSSKFVNITFPPCKKSGREVIKVNNLAQEYGSLKVFSDVNFTINRGEKIALVGVNGAGKSTLLRLISKTEKPTIGGVTYGKDVRTAYFSQESTNNLNFDFTIWEEIEKVSSLFTQQERRNALGAFMFSGDDIYKPISVLSGGEKSRLSLLKILLQNSNLLILDEPTNHLDLKTKDIFQSALKKYNGTVFIVSHDRYFLDNLVSKIYEIRDGGLVEYFGNYSEFVEKRNKQLQGVDNLQVQTITKGVNSKKEARKLQAQNRKEKSYIKKKINTVEKEISDIEIKKAEYEQILCGTEIYKDSEKLKEVNTKLKSISSDLDNLYDKWNDLLKRLDG